MKEFHYFLGIEVIRTPNDIMLSQRRYILNLL